MTASDRQEAVDRANREAADAVETAAAQQREKLIDVVYIAMLAHVADQQGRMKTLEAEGLLGKVGFEWTVLLTYTSLPFEDDHPKPALSLLLEPDENRGQLRRGKEKIMVFMPVDDEVVLDKDFDSNTLERPARIVVERYDENGQVRSFIVTDEKIEEFLNPAHAEDGEQRMGEEFDLFDIVKTMQKFSGRVNPMDAMVAPLLTDLANWTVKVQRFEEPQPGFET